MERKKLTRLLTFIGVIAGGYLPLLWGASAFSFTSLLCATIGGFVGIWAAFRLTR